MGSARYKSSDRVGAVWRYRGVSTGIRERNLVARRRLCASAACTLNGAKRKKKRRIIIVTWIRTKDLPIRLVSPLMARESTAGP